MRLVAVDNDVLALESLARRLKALLPECEIVQMTDPLLSAKYICNNPVDVVLLETEMRPADGLELLKVLRTQKAELPVIMLSDNDDSKNRALALAADGYLVRPITDEQLREIAKA